MAPGSHPRNPAKDKDERRTGRHVQEVVDSGSMGTLSPLDANQIAHVDSDQQPWPALNKTILPPPKKRHPSPHPGQPSRIIYMQCKENKGERGGSLTSRISALSPGTKRKILGYAADGSIPPLPPRQKRIKRAAKQSSRDTKQCTKYTRMVEPSGLLGDLKPGIMRQQTRTRRHIHAVLGAVVGDLPQKDGDVSSLPAIGSFCFETHTIHEFPPQLDDPPVECSGLQNQTTQEETVVRELPDVRSGASEQCGLQQTDGKSDRMDVLDEFCDTGARTCPGVVNTHERASGFVRFQRDSLHACNQKGLIPPTDSLKNSCAGDRMDPTSQSRHAQLLVDLKQEPEPASTSGRETCAGEIFECKQEEIEEDDCRYPLDFPSVSDDAGPSFTCENATQPHLQDSKLLVSVAAANVATRWLELLSLDVKGRLAALKRSKRRVGNVIVSGELDLDAPLLPCTFGGAAPTNSTPSGSNQADQGAQVDSWRKVFESMDRALTVEGNKLESWLQQIHVMQAECQRDMSMPLSTGPPSLSEPTPQRSQETQQALPASAAASVLSTANFASQLGDLLRTG